MLSVRELEPESHVRRATAISGNGFYPPSALPRPPGPSFTFQSRPSRALRRGRSPRSALPVYLGIVLSLAVPDAYADPVTDAEDTSIRAMRGIYQLETALPLSAHPWVLGTGVAFFTADNLALAGEHHRRLKWRVAFAFSPWGALDLGMTWTSTSDSSRPVLPSSTQTTGDPELSAKWSHDLGSRVALGALLRVLVPTSADGSSLAFNATTVTGQALATYRPLRALALVLDAGYRFDNTRKVFATGFAAGEETLMRFDGNVALANAIVGGLGAIGYLPPSRRLKAAPFLELMVAVAPGASFEHNPIAVNIGAKALVGSAGLIEVSAGTSVRLSGGPHDLSKFPGLPPWEMFAHLTYHGAAAAAGQIATCRFTACDERTPCAEHFACVEGACLPVQEVVREAAKPQVAPTFFVGGAVSDASTGNPVRGAAIRFNGSESALLTDGSGAFLSWPIVVDDGLLQVSATAAGFRPSQQLLSKGPAGETKQLAINLVPLDRKVVGYIRGSLRDKTSGLPVAGVVSIRSAGQKVHTNKEGAFALELEAGRYELLITAPSMKPQEKQISLRPDELIILNIDMTPQRK